MNRFFYKQINWFEMKTLGQSNAVQIAVSCEIFLSVWSIVR